jgi:hypothetical protein
MPNYDTQSALMPAIPVPRSLPGLPCLSFVVLPGSSRTNYTQCVRCKAMAVASPRGRAGHARRVCFADQRLLSPAVRVALGGRWGVVVHECGGYIMWSAYMNVEGLHMWSDMCIHMCGEGPKQFRTRNIQILPGGGVVRARPTALPTGSEDP